MRELKNILIIYDFNFINGGGAQVAILTANEMAAAGYNVIFFSAVTRPEGSQLSPKVKQYSTLQPDILTNPSRLNAMATGIWNKKAVDMLRMILRSLLPAETIVHLHGWVKALSPSIGKVLTDSAFPVVCTLHDYFAACPNGGFYNYQQNAICRLKAMSLSCICTNCDARSYSHKIWRVARQVVQRHAGIPKSIRHFITVSGFSETIYRPYLPEDATVYQISSPIISKPDKQKRANTYSGRLIIIGRVSPEKGVNLACEAARITRVPLTVIGDGDQLESLQKEFPEVEFKGWLSHSAVMDEMLNATALIFPSICYETQGLTVPEALSVGLPVIVSDECAASEYVNGNNGFTFRSNNVADLVDKIRQLFSEPEKTAQMGEYAYTDYWQHPLTPEVYINQLTAAYLSILNEKIN